MNGWVVEEDRMEGNGSRVDKVQNTIECQLSITITFPSLFNPPTMFPINHFMFSNKQDSKNRHRSREYPES